MQYELKVYRAADGISVLQLSAADEPDARRQAETQGYRVIAVQRRLSGLALWPTRQGFAVNLFSQELLALLDAGLSLVDAVDMLARKSRQADSRHILQQLASQLRQGQSLSRALDAIPGAFPALYIATIRTAEQSGSLADALRRYLQYQQQLNLVRDKVVAASVYPLVLLTVGAAVIVFLLAYVVPRFSRVYEGSNHDLPWLSRVMMEWGQLFAAHSGLIGITFAIGVLALIVGLRQRQVRALIERRLWAVPTLGEKMRLYQLARFTRTLAMLVNAGIAFVTALDMVRDLLNQAAMLDGLQQARQMVCEGRSVSDAFAAHGLATEIGVRLLVVGERSGELGASLERIAKLYDDELARWVDWFGRLFEPLLMIVIGFAIGLIVVLMYLPIFELAGSIQ